MRVHLSFSHDVLSSVDTAGNTKSALKKREISKSTFKVITFLPLLDSRYSGANYDGIYCVQVLRSGVILCSIVQMLCHTTPLTTQTLDSQDSLTKLHVQAFRRMASGSPPGTAAFDVVLP